MAYRSSLPGATTAIAGVRTAIRAGGASRRKICCVTGAVDGIMPEHVMSCSMTSAEHFDRDGRRISVERSAELSKDPEYVAVAVSEVRGYVISTDWLGLAQLNMRQPPLLFETMIRSPDARLLDYQEQYSTEEAARLGHARAEEYVRGLPDDET